MTVHILMVIPFRQFPKLTRESHLARVIHTPYAPAVASPVAERTHNLIQQRIIGVHSTTLTHRHVMRRIKTTRADMPPRTRFLRYSVNRVLRAQRVAVVLNQPQVMLLAECLHSLQVKRITQRMRQHHSLHFRTICSLQLALVNIKRTRLHIHEHRHSTELNDRVYRRRKSRSHSNHLITAFDSTFTQFRRRQRIECQQIRTTSGVRHCAVFHAQPFRQTCLELMCPRTGCQPEVQ